MALKFSNTDTVLGSHIELAADSDINNLEDISIACWMYLDGWGGSNYGRIVDKCDSGTEFIFQVASQSSASSGKNALYFTRKRATSSQICVTAEDTLSLGAWYHTIVAADADGVNIYINGALAANAYYNAGSGDFEDDSACRFYIGNRTDYARYFLGSIADFRIYNRVLSATEAKIIYHLRGHDSVFGGLVRRFKMGERHIGADGRAGAYYIDSTKTKSSGTSIVLDVPAHIDGDLLLAVIALAGAGTTPADMTTPGGWTLIGTVDTDTSTTTCSLWAYRREASSEPSDYTFSYDQSCPAIGTIISYDQRVVSMSHENVATNTGSGFLPVAPSVSPTANSMIVRCDMVDGDQLPYIENDVFPADAVGRECDEETASTTVTLAVADQLKPSGASGTCTFNSKQSTKWATMSISFNGGTGVLDSRGVVDMSPAKTNGKVQQKVLYAPDYLTWRRRI